MWSMYFGEAQRREGIEKSYVSAYSQEFPVQEDLTLYKLFEQARNDGHVGEIVNLETGERVKSTSIMEKVRHSFSFRMMYYMPLYMDRVFVLPCQAL